MRKTFAILSSVILIIGVTFWSPLFLHPAPLSAIQNIKAGNATVLRNIPNTPDGSPSVHQATSSPPFSSTSTTKCIPSPGTSHSPITIDGDAAFASQASSEGWAGTGNPGDPYIIENLDIDRAYTSGSCINISNTQVHFTIRFCTLIHATEAGIFLNNVGNGTLANNNCTANSYGIHLNSSIYNVVANNTCYDHYGIFFSYSDNNLLTNNTCINYFYTIFGISLHDSDDNTVTNNTCIACSYGIFILHPSVNNDVLWNAMVDSSQDNAVSWSGNFFDYNYYSDYSGTDGDDDGVGDTAHPIPSGLQDLHPLMYTPTPVWLDFPPDQTLEFTNRFQYDLNITTPSSLDQWWINDTTHFTIDSDGILTDTMVLPEGAYGVRVRVTNFYGISLTSTFTLMVQNTPPSWDETPTDQTLEFGDSFTYDVNASDLSGIDHYEINDTTHFAIDSSGVITNTSNLVVGVYWLEVRAYDPYNSQCSSTFNVTVQDTTPPHWIVVPSDQFSEFGQPFDYHVQASDLSGIDHWSIEDAYSWTHGYHYYFTISATGHLTNTTWLPIDIYALNVTAYDSYDNSISAIFSITVDDTTPPTWVMTPTDQTLEFGDNFYSHVQASDPSGIDHYWINDTRFTINKGGYINDEIAGNLPLPVGVYWLEVRAYDAYYVYDPDDHFCSCTFKVTVQDTTPPEWWFEPSDRALAFGEALDYQMTAEDLSGIHHWTIDDTTHFSIAESTGNNHGYGRLTSIVMLETGSYNVTISVFDPYDNQLSATITITVAPAPLIPGFPLTAIALGVVTGVGLCLIFRRHHRRTP